jgi:nuclear autoantigenic sperm protein
MTDSYPVDPPSLLSEGKKYLILCDVEKAVFCFQQAAKQLDETYGAGADECGEAYLFYGKALFQLARAEMGVFGSGIPGGEQAEKEESESEDDQEEENKQDLEEDNHTTKRETNHVTESAETDKTEAAASSKDDQIEETKTDQIEDIDQEQDTDQTEKEDQTEEDQGEETDQTEEVNTDQTEEINTDQTGSSKVENGLCPPILCIRCLH